MAVPPVNLAIRLRQSRDRTRPTGLIRDRSARRVQPEPKPSRNVNTFEEQEKRDPPGRCCHPVGQPSVAPVLSQGSRSLGARQDQFLVPDHVFACEDGAWPLGLANSDEIDCFMRLPLGRRSRAV
jgi:hypothetical protein